MSSNFHHQPQISVVLPTHRNDGRFHRALLSVAWADEIIIVDHGAKIDSSSLKTSAKLKIITTLKLDDFSAMRNHAIQTAHNDWVFFLDSDEWVSSELATEVLETIARPTYDAYLLQRIDVLYGQPVTHGEVGNAWMTRLINKNAGKWHGKVHETFVVSPHKKLGRLHATLLHEPHPSLHEFVQKVNTYTTFAAAEHPESFIVLKTLFLPLGKFVYTFFVRGGFLDGYRGLIYSFMMSIHSLTVRVKRYESV